MKLSTTIRASRSAPESMTTARIAARQLCGSRAAWQVTDIAAGQDSKHPTERELAMWNLIVFAVIGLLTGAAARLAYPGRRSTRILSTMLIGIIGAVLGGMFSWIWWPAVNGEFHTGNFILSVLGAMVVIALWAGVAYKRSLSGYRNESR